MLFSLEYFRAILKNVLKLHKHKFASKLSASPPPWAVPMREGDLADWSHHWMGITLKLISEAWDMKLEVLVVKISWSLWWIIGLYDSRVPNFEWLAYCLVFGTCWVQLSDRTSVALQDACRGPSSVTSGLVPQIRLRLFPSTSLPIHYSLINLWFDTVHSEFLT
jgi:hypothetical protein